MKADPLFDRTFAIAGSPIVPAFKNQPPLAGPVWYNHRETGFKFESQAQSIYPLNT